jgi:hypothetical protein
VRRVTHLCRLKKMQQQVRRVTHLCRLRESRRWRRYVD